MQYKKGVLKLEKPTSEVACVEHRHRRVPPRHHVGVTLAGDHVLVTTCRKGSCGLGDAVGLIHLFRCVRPGRNLVSGVDMRPPLQLSISLSYETGVPGQAPVMMIVE